MSQTKLAYRYAKSLFSYAAELGKKEEIAANMYVLKKLDGKIVYQLNSLFTNHLIQIDKKIDIIKSIFKDFSYISIEFIEFLFHRKRQSLLFEIASQYQYIYYSDKEIVEVFIISAYEMAEELKQQMRDKIKTLYKANQHLFFYQIEASIIGGFIIKIKDKQWDFSIKNQFNKLRDKLIDPSYIKKY